jgi:hypothetical protein
VYGLRFQYGVYLRYCQRFIIILLRGFEINFKPIPFAILFIIGTLLIPIQTSTEEYVLEVT